MLTFAGPVSRRVPVACLAHRPDVAEGVWTAGRNPVDFPLTPQHRITPACVVGAYAHCAFAPTTGPVVYIIAESHSLTSLLFEFNNKSDDSLLPTIGDSKMVDLLHENNSPPRS